jgi:hypothetical protein
MDEENILGGGAGGDTGMTSDDGNKGHQVKSAKHTYQIGGNQVVLVSRIPTPKPDDEDTPDPSMITLLAGGSLKGNFVDDGLVNIRGCKGVRITSGPLAIPVISPSTKGASTDGVEVVVSEQQSISLVRGITEDVNQSIALTQNNIVINAGLQGTLTLCAGLNEITIGPSGILINGLTVQLNPGAPDMPPPLPPGEEYA